MQIIDEVIEKHPREGDVSEDKAEKLLPQADVIGITGTAFTTHTIEHLAAAGAKPAIDEARQKFEEQYGSHVEVSYGGGGEILSQMILSRSSDVYIAPEQRLMEAAKEKGAIDPDTI